MRRSSSHPTSLRPVLLAGLLLIGLSACEANLSGITDDRHLMPSAIIMGTDAG